ncbi:MAG: hypothetical protein RMK18_05955 [Armatimonadota bacterium]|nr:hypothetical protein [Armatimonadota bacterium]MCX7777340.1 hypothetical protein [Armatimonadota bacterium]MDW8025392.1 hypothetical protein [Armatimonadota bacterium]
MNEFFKGLLVGLLIGEGHFGGDGKQPHITLRMHTRHRKLFELLTKIVPGSRVYGPYTHGGRSYYQWMVRGEPLRQLMEWFENVQLNEIDDYAWQRYKEMKHRYRLE